MHEKLKELTEKIYQEGVTKANEEAEKIIAEAKKKSEEIVKSAHKEAEKLQKEARQKAEELGKNTESELRIAFRQAMSALKQEIEKMILMQTVEEPVEKAFQSGEFVNQLILTMAEKWDPKQSENGLVVLVPEKKQQETEKYLKGKVPELLKKGLKIQPSSSLVNGFEIKPEKAGFKISITDKDLEAYLKEYFRPGLRKMLFEGENGQDG